MAFLRVVSGKFERGMNAVLGRTAKPLRLAKPQPWPRALQVSRRPARRHYRPVRPGQPPHRRHVRADRPQAEGIPASRRSFRPSSRTLRRKHLDQGLKQLSHEGVIRLFHRPDVGLQDLWLGAVGQLQFEVLKERLKNEYNVKAILEPLPYRVPLIGGEPAALEWLKARRDYIVVLDRADRPCLLSDSEWPLNYAMRQQEGLVLHDVELL